MPALRRRTRATTSAAPASAPARRAFVVIVGLVVVFVRLLGFGRVQFGGDQGVVLGAEIDLVVVIDEIAGAFGLGPGLEALLALEGLDLLDGDLELVRDPRVRPPLTHPGADSVQFRS